MRVLIVGGGVLGTMHAWAAVERGHDVVQLEREPEARGASVRNFGLVWVGGRAEGEELAAAQRARTLWAELGERVPGLGFRANGSVTVLRTEAEHAVAMQTVARAGAGERGLKLLDATEARACNPALRGELLGGLWCELDAVVEPRTAQPALRAALAVSGRYTWLPGREARALTGGGVTDDRGERHGADAVVLCTGASLGGLAGELAGNLPVRRVRLQMAQTEPLPDVLTTSVADGDSLRYYPGYRGDALDALNRAEPQGGVAAREAMQLLMVQRLDGSLTIGDTHAYTEPFPFDVGEEPYDHLRTVAGRILGRELPRIVRRWAGVYAQTTDPARVVHRARVADAAWLVTGPGGRGMTCSPAIAERTAEELGW